jgi:hypothetical protein
LHKLAVRISTIRKRWAAGRAWGFFCMLALAVTRRGEPVAKISQPGFHLAIPKMSFTAIHRYFRFPLQMADCVPYVSAKAFWTVVTHG